MKFYAEKYKKEDKYLSDFIVDHKFKAQQLAMQNYGNRMQKYQDAYESQKAERARLRDGQFSDDEDDLVEVESYEERVVDVQEEELEI